MSWPDGYAVTYGYDALNRMQTATEVGTGTVLGTWKYDPMSRPTSLVRGNRTSTAWSYDPGSRLVSLAHTMPSSTAQAVSFGLAWTAANQLMTFTVSNPLYVWGAAASSAADTANGLNQSATIAAVGTGGYDLNGDEVNDGTRTFAYDEDGRLTSATMTAGGNAVGLSYDPMGRIWSYASEVSGVTTPLTFLYDGQRLVAEYQGSTLLRRYVHGPGTDNPLVWIEVDAGNDHRYLHQDQRGSVIAQSNASGAVTATYAYDPYGVPQGWSGSRFAYTGQIMLPEVQLYHYKARAYDPTLGRFLQTDPIGTEGGVNLYQYVLGDPVDATDPTGHNQSLTEMGSNWIQLANANNALSASGGSAAQSTAPSMSYEAYQARFGQYGLSPNDSVGKAEGQALNQITNSADFQSRAYYIYGLSLFDTAATGHGVEAGGIQVYTNFTSGTGDIPSVSLYSYFNTDINAACPGGAAACETPPAPDSQKGTLLLEYHPHPLTNGSVPSFADLTRSLGLQTPGVIWYNPGDGGQPGSILYQGRASH